MAHTRRAFVVAVFVPLVALAAGCGGANERRASTNQGPPPGVSTVAGAPSTPATPPKVSDPQCAPIANFQLWNFSAGSLDTKKDGDKKDGIIKGLEDAGAKAAAAIPELGPAIKVVIEQDKAALNGSGKYTPAAGEPSVEEAGQKLFAWSKDKNC